MWGLEPDRYGRKKMREDASSRGRSGEERGKRGGGGGVQQGDKVKSSGGNWRLHERKGMSN